MNYNLINIQKPVVTQAVSVPKFNVASPQIQAPKFDFPLPRRYASKPHYILDYNDPYAINSMADVILTTFRNDMNRHDFGGLEDIPILNVVPNALGMLWDTTVNPIAHGQWGAATTNLLTNMSETLDVVANPTKAVLMGNGLEGAKDALGFGKYGRGNYDWNTGNIVTDIAAEVVSDPINWITLFGKGIVTKLLGNGILKPLLAELPQEASEQVVKGIAKSSIKKLFEGSAKSLDEAISDTLTKAVGKDGKLLFNAQSIMNIRNLINDDMTLNLLAGTSKIIRPAEAFEDLTWKTVWYSSGYGSGYWLAKKAFKPVGDYFRATTENALKKYTTPAGYVDPLQDELVDQMYKNHAHALGDILGIDDLPEDLAQIVIKRGIATEKSALYNWIKTDLRTMPFANVEEKMAYIESEIQTKFHLTTDELHKYLAAISTDDESLKKFADTLMNITDKDVQAKYMKRQEYYKIQKEVLAFLKKTGELEPSKRFDAVNKFLQENFQMDVTQFTKYIEDPDLDGSADWFRDYFTNVKIDSMKHSLLKKEIKDEFNKIIYGEDEYEGGTRLAVLNDFMKGQHNIDLDNYIEVIKAKAQKNPDMYQKYFEDLVQMKKRLEIKDAMAKDISQVRAKATLTKELKKRSTDLFEDVVKMETSLTDMYEGLPKSLPTLLRKVDSGFTIEEITTRATATLTKVNDAFRNLIKDPFLLQDTKLSKAVDQFEQLTDDFNNWLLNLKSAKDVKGMDKLSKQINETINTIKMRLAQLQNLPSDAPKLNKFVTLKQGMKQGQDLFKKMQQKLINANAPENLEEAIAILQKQYPDVPVETLIEDYKKAIDDSIFVRSTDKVLRMNKKDGVELITKKEIDDFQTVLFDFFGMDTSVEEAVLKAYEEDITLPEYIAQTVLDWVSSVFSEPLLINEWVKAITDIFSNERDACYEGLQNFFNLLSFAKLIEPAQVTDKPNTLFNKFEPYLFSSAKLMQDTKAVTADTIRYAMKVNANQVVDLMMTDEHFQEIVESLLTPGTTLGDFLDTAIANGNQEAVIFKDRIQSFINYRDFLDLLYNYVGVNHDGFDAVRPNVINAFTDVLQMSARTDPENIADNIHSVFYYIMQRTEEQLQSYTMPGSYSIEALSKRPEILEALAKHNIDPTEVHHALDDSKMTRIVREQLLGEKFAGKHVYDFDIESTGLDAGLGTVVEIAGVGDNFEFNAVRELFQDEVPKVSAIRKMYDLPADMSNAEVREYWQEYYRLNGSGNERTILKRFIQKLQELNADPDAVINFHNGYKFDRVFLINRMKDYLAQSQGILGVDADIFSQGIALMKKLQFTDSYKMLQEADGLPVISAIEKDQMYSAFEFLVSSQLGQGRLIQPIDTAFAEAIKNIVQSVVDTNRKLHIKNMSEAQLSEANSLVSDIYLFFKSIKDSNRVLKRTEIDKSLFDNDYVKAVNGNHIMQALNTYVEDGARQIIPGVQQYGVSKIIDMPKVREFFDLNKLLQDYLQIGGRTEDDFWKNEAMWKYYTTQAKILENNLDRLKNLRNIPMVDLPMLVQKAEMPGWTKYLDLGMADDHSVAVAQTLLNLGRKQLIPNVTAEDLLGKELADALEETASASTHTLAVNQKWYSYMENDLESLIDVEVQALYQQDRVNKKFGQTLLNWINNESPEFVERRQRWQTWFKEWEAQKIANQQKLVEIAQKQDTYKQGLYQNMLKVVDTFTAKTQKDFWNAGVEAYYKSIQEALDLYDKYGLDPLISLGETFDVNDAHRAVIQKRAVGMKYIHDLLTSTQEVIGKYTSPEAAMNHITKHQQVAELTALQETLHVLQMDPEQLFRHLVHNAKNLIMFDMVDYLKYPLMADAYTIFKENIKAYKEAGIDMVEEGGYVYLVPSGARQVIITNGMVNIPKPVMKDIDFEGIVKTVFTEPEEQKIAEAYIAARAHLNDTVLDGAHIGSTGQITHKKFYTNLYDALPNSVKNKLTNFAALDHWYYSGNNFNHTLLGPIKSRRLYQDTGVMLNKFMPSDMLSILSNTYANQGKYLKSEVEYMNFFFDKTMSINVGFMSQLSDQELLEAFQKSPDFKLAVLVKDSHSSNGVRVEQIKPNNLHSIATARRLDAVVLSNQTFSKAFETINEGKFDSTALNLWHKITYLYKAGFLLNPGVILRNMIDSTLKNYVTSADPIGMTQSYAKALSMYPKYVATIRDMLHKAPEGRLTSEWTEEYFKSNFARMTKQEYLLIHGFIEDGPSAGLTKELQDYYSKNLQKGAWSSVTHLLSLMMEPNKQVEQISRLAEYFWAIEKNGMSNTAAYELISKTHFDYALKTNVDKLIELVFPFYTFTLNNYSFWIDMITSKPWLMSVFRDVMTPSWNFDELDFHDLNHNRSMQYQILAGNLKISDSGMTLKLNPSFMDVFNIMTDPVNALKSKLNTPLRAGVDTLTGVASGEGFGTVITDTTNALSLIPLAGGIGNQIPLISPQGQKYYERTGNILNAILPSIFGATAQYPNKVKQQYTKKTWVKKPGKPHKTYFKAKHFDKYYPKYPKRVSRGSFYAENFYSKLYTKKGVSRMKLRSIPVTPMTVKYRMKDYWYFFK